MTCSGCGTALILAGSRLACLRVPQLDTPSGLFDERVEQASTRLGGRPHQARDRLWRPSGGPLRPGLRQDRGLSDDHQSERTILELPGEGGEKTWPSFVGIAGRAPAPDGPRPHRRGPRHVARLGHRRRSGIRPSRLRGYPQEASRARWLCRRHSSGRPRLTRAGEVGSPRAEGMGGALQSSNSHAEEIVDRTAKLSTIFVEGGGPCPPQR